MPYAEIPKQPISAPETAHPVPHKNQQQGCDGGNADTYYLFGVQLLFFHLICHLKSTPLDVLLNYTIIIRFKQGKYFKKTEKSFSLIR